MKKIFKICAATVLAFTISSCNDSFLDKAPTTTLNEVTTFGSYNSTKAYMWKCYGLFTNTPITTNKPVNIGTSVNTSGKGSVYQSDWNAGYLSNRANGANKYALQTIVTADDNNGWNFEYIYHINIMLKALETSSMSQDEINHWKAVGYFFHSYWYMELIDRFGDVPWIENVIDETSEETYGPRIARKTVADKVMERLKWAEQNIGDFNDGDNTINKSCVQMVLSRFTLREGTWRKYHKLGDYTSYLEECVRVSSELMEAYPTLYEGTDGQPAAGYGELWTTRNLAGVPGVILYKEYLTSYLTQGFNFNERNDQFYFQLTQDMADMYLSKNGLPIANTSNDMYKGASKDIYDIFRDRDPRMYHTVVPPYVIAQNGANKPVDANGNPISSCRWGYNTTAPKYREYMDIMGINTECTNPSSTEAMKRLPIGNWNFGTIITKVPNLTGAGQNACSSTSGYYIWKNYSCWESSDNNSNKGDADKPIFKVEEAILNYAEAACELDLFKQNEADRSINRLRNRAGVTPMNVNNIGSDFDPNRDKGHNDWWSGDLEDYEVPALLWEVRRERIIELMGEGFGFYDVRRWAKAPYFINRQEKGMWWVNGSTPYGKNPKGVLDETTGLQILLKDMANNQGGYIYINPSPKVQGKGWLDKYYLYCVPTKELTLNPALTQNPGWPNADGSIAK